MTKRDDEVSVLVANGMDIQKALSLNRAERRKLIAQQGLKVSYLKNDIQVVGRRWGNRQDIPGIAIQEPPSSILALREELTKHVDIYDYAIKGNNFEECCARIAERLDIVVDGAYDADKLCSMLVNALRNRRFHGSQPHLRAGGLQAVEIVERKDNISLEVKTDNVPYVEGKKDE